MTRQEKVETFRALHTPGAPLVMPNPWDLGSLRIFEALGARAVATTSSGHAFTLGRPDKGLLSRDEALEHAASLAAATALPVNGDFENGFGASPEIVAETVRMAAEAGLAGVSIEDTDLPGAGAYSFEMSLERIEAAVEAAGTVGIVLTARADGWINRTYDGDEALRRCRAFAEAGAEVIYAPLVKDSVIRDLCAIGPAVNALAAGRTAEHSVESLGDLGVARISVGGTIARLAQIAVLDAARTILQDGDLSVLARAGAVPEIDEILKG